MALPNLSGSNIQETYQRVLHTDGTNIYDGTGSIFIPATASYAVSASYEINYETSSSYAETASFANDFTVAGNITANTYVGIPTIIAQSSLRLASFDPVKVYYGHNNGWQVGGYISNVASASDWKPAASAQHNYIQVPFGYKNLRMLGTVQVAHAAAGTSFQVLKSKRMNGGEVGGSTQPTLSLMLNYTHTNTSIGESRFYNFDVTSSNEISAGEQLLFAVDPSGSSSIIKCSYVIYGESI